MKKIRDVCAGTTGTNLSRPEIVFVGANARQDANLQLDKECRGIQDSIQKSALRDHIAFCSHWALRDSDLNNLLCSHRPTIFHFSGHGTGQEGLCLLSEDDTMMMVSADELTSVIRAARVGVSVVVLSACYSEVQAKSLIDVVPCVICISGTISDRAALRYAREFYSALACGRSVASAHEFGLVGLRRVEQAQDSQARDVSGTELSQQLPSVQMLAKDGVDPDSLFLVAPPTGGRVEIKIRATMADIDGHVIDIISDYLRRLTGDPLLRIIIIKKGSVQLTVALTREAIKELESRHVEGQLKQLCGFDVLSLTDVSDVDLPYGNTATAAPGLPNLPEDKATTPTTRSHLRAEVHGALGGFAAPRRPHNQ